jgi:hypothetical protein
MTGQKRDWSQAKRQRQRVFQLRLTDDEHAELAARAESAGVSVAGLIRHRCLEQSPPRARRRPHVDAAALMKLLGQVGHIGSNINQLARAANAGGWPSHSALDDAARDVADMRAAIRRALGKDPTG